MAIFSRTQIPKYQSPIRITRPYIKPNSLSDTITSAIQGYGSIQGMNMQRQLFNAKLKEAADAKAQRELDQAGVRQAIMGTGVGAQAAGTATMNLQGGDPYGIAGIPAYSQGALNQTYQYDTPAVPGMSPLDSLRAAMQANPQANPTSLMAIASGLKGLQATPARAMSAGEALRLELSRASGRRGEERLGMTQKKYAATMNKLTNDENSNFLLRFDDYIKNNPEFSEWDTLVGAGGPDLTGAKALQAFGVTRDDEEWENVRQTAKRLYRHYRDNTNLDDDEIDAKIFQYIAKGVMPKLKKRFYGEEVSQKVNPSEIVEAMELQKTRVKSHNLTIRN